MSEPETIRRLIPWALLATAAAALGSAYVSEYGFGYEPCVLCLYQRVPWAVIALLGVAALFLPAFGQRRMILLLAAAAYLAGGAIAFYHVGVEQMWWSAVTSCGGGTEGITSTQDLFASLQQKPEKSCGDIDWTLFGISMATYNAAVSIVLALVSLWAWRRLKEDAL